MVDCYIYLLSSPPESLASRPLRTMVDLTAFLTEQRVAAPAVVAASLLYSVGLASYPAWTGGADKIVLSACEEGLLKGVLAVLGRPRRIHLGPYRPGQANHIPELRTVPSATRSVMNSPVLRLPKHQRNHSFLYLPPCISLSLAMDNFL